MAADFKIHLFTPEDGTFRDSGFPVREEIECVNKLLDAGLDFLHLRKPSMSSEAIVEYIKEIPSRHRSRLVLHDFPRLAVKFGCGFQMTRRLTLDDASFIVINSIDGIPSPLAKSCHSIQEVREAVEKQALEFVTLSPIFDSISKTGYESRFPLGLLAAENLERVVALGGVTLDSFPLLMQTGFGGAALLGEIWNEDSSLVKGSMARLLRLLRLRNIPLQFITDGKTPEETIRQARMALEGGGKWIQVRMKDAPLESVSGVLEELLPECERRGAVLIVDDHVGLASLCHGVHLGQCDVPVAEARKVLTEDMIIGLTVNCREHVEASRISLPDYYGMGPFRFTSTKRNLAPILGIDGYSRLVPKLERPVVAIGGIGLEDIGDVMATGVDGIAVSSLITRSDHPAATVSAILDKIKSTKTINL